MNDPSAEAAGSLKKTRYRSSAYPAYTLEEALKYSELLLKAYPRGTFNRLAAVNAMKHNTISGTSTKKVAALLQYGLIENTKEGYLNSDLAKHICYDPNDQVKTEAIKKAVKTPKLYLKLIKEYDGRDIPVSLSNILILSHDINTSVAERVAKNFIESIQFAGLYKGDVISSGLSNETQITSANDCDDEETGVKEDRGGERRAASTVDGTTVIPLPNDIVISYSQRKAYAIQTNDNYMKAIKLLAEIKIEVTKEESNEKETGGDLTSM